MNEPLPRAAAAAHLTDAFRRAGVLPDARVAAVEVVQVRPTILSCITRLRLTYDGTAPDAPTAVLLKTPMPERREASWTGGRHEVAFYTKLASQMPSGLVPHCFDATWDEATNDWHLVLEDLTETHATPTEWPLPPNASDCHRIIAAWARCQAAWWDHPGLDREVGAWPDETGLRQMVDGAEAQIAALVDRMGEDFPPARRRLYARYLAAAPLRLARLRTRRHITIVHGDAHVWNCLLPRDPASDDARLFDWDCWRLGIGAEDLAYMMAMHWYPERRQRLERPLLDAFRAALTAHGVSGYDRAALDEDYRLGVLRQMIWPVRQAAAGIPPVIWWNNLQRIWFAVDDLGCAELID